MFDNVDYKSYWNFAEKMYKYNKFQLQIDANDEISCWAISFRQPYKDRLSESVKAMMHEYWVENYRVSPNTRDVIQRRIS